MYVIRISFSFVDSKDDDDGDNDDDSGDDVTASVV